MNIDRKKEFISFLIESNVLIFGDFTTKSGRKTPYFINTGNFKTAKQFNILGHFYAELVYNSKVLYDALFGPAYKGIPLVLSCCNALYTDYKLNKPFFFNRKEEKDHGEGGNFIGYTPKKNEEIIIVEDVLTAGTAVKEVLPILKFCFDVSCSNLFVLVDRCEVSVNSSNRASLELKEKFNITVNSLVDIKDILKFLSSNEKFKEHKESMQNYIQKFCIL